MTVSKGNWMVNRDLQACVTFIREYFALLLSMHFELEFRKGV
jgi:hypothetical protein